MQCAPCFLAEAPPPCGTQIAARSGKLLMSYWIYLGFAIVAEVAGTACLKLSHGFEVTTYAVLVYVLYGLSFYLLALALKGIDVSVAYAIWAGVGVALISVLGLVVFKEAFTALKAASLAVIIAGVVGLNLAGAHADS